jgi:hypothetical protein
MPPFHSVQPLRPPVYRSPSSPYPCSARRRYAGAVLCALLGLLSLVLTLQACKGAMDAQGQGGPQPETPRVLPTLPPQPETPRVLPTLPPSAGAAFDAGKAAYERRDYTTAAQKFRPSAQAGHAAAQNMLGRIYENGRGLPQNYDEAAQWYRRAAEQGYVVSQFQLGQMYQWGMGRPRDFLQAYYWYNLGDYSIFTGFWYGSGGAFVV